MSARNKRTSYKQRDTRRPDPICRVEIFALDLPLREPVFISLGRFDCAKIVVVRLTAKGGSSGQGEGCPFPEITGETQAAAFAAGRDLAPLFLNRDPLDLDPVLDLASRALPGLPSLRAAFDLALHDLAAQQLGVPLHTLFGCACPNREFQTCNTVYLAPAETMARRAEAFAQRGYQTIKIKVGRDPGETVRRVRAVREAVGPDPTLILDANQAWDVPAAIQTLRALEPFSVAYCEQPVRHWDRNGLARVARESPIPVMADESLWTSHDAAALAAAQACQYFNIKTGKAGGLHDARRILAIAEGFGIPCQIGAMVETRFALTASVHLAAAHPIIRFLDLDTFELHAEDAVEGGITIDSAGRITLPEGPGLGARFRDEVLHTAQRTAYE
jgi:o-succinylbenzoate synthase